MSNVLLAITPRPSSERDDLRGQRTELVDPTPLATTITAMDYLNVEAVDYVNAIPVTRWIT